MDYIEEFHVCLNFHTDSLVFSCASVDRCNVAFLQCFAGFLGGGFICGISVWLYSAQEGKTKAKPLEECLTLSSLRRTRWSRCASRSPSRWTRNPSTTTISFEPSTSSFCILGEVVKKMFTNLMQKWSFSVFFLHLSPLLCEVDVDRLSQGYDRVISLPQGLKSGSTGAQTSSSPIGALTHCTIEPLLPCYVSLCCVEPNFWHFSSIFPLNVCSMAMDHMHTKNVCSFPGKWELQKWFYIH